MYCRLAWVLFLCNFWKEKVLMLWVCPAVRNFQLVCCVYHSSFVRHAIGTRLHHTPYNIIFSLSLSLSLCVSLCVSLSLPTDLTSAPLEVGQLITVTTDSGRSFQVKLRIDTAVELDYVR